MTFLLGLLLIRMQVDRLLAYRLTLISLVSVKLVHMV
nr:MAG TPA: hypothetical protein [Caudoviricetes sp.]